MHYFGSAAYIPYWILVIVSLVLGLGTQAYIKHVYKKYSLVPSGFNASGASVARAMMDANGASAVGIKHIDGELTDNFDPRDNCLHLSDDNFSEGNVASLAVSCHEAGHAVQTAKAFWPARLRTALVPVVNFAASAWIYIFIAGVFFNMSGMTIIAIWLYALTFLFHIVTLPVEIDASRRGLAFLKKNAPVGFDYAGARQVLIAAALTYVAAALVSALQLVYLLASSRNRN
ncbi:MAG: zinc metallopeptidase [Atopobiaceae bacterium]|nr:zinc metallopeptidase [Atopobiaceae bacterium]